MGDSTSSVLSSGCRARNSKKDPGEGPHCSGELPSAAQWCGRHGQVRQGERCCGRDSGPTGRGYQPRLGAS